MCLERTCLKTRSRIESTRSRRPTTSADENTATPVSKSKSKETLNRTTRKNCNGRNFFVRAHFGRCPFDPSPLLSTPLCLLSSSLFLSLSLQFSSLLPFQSHSSHCATPSPCALSEPHSCVFTLFEVKASPAVEVRSHTVATQDLLRHPNPCVRLRCTGARTLEPRVSQCFPLSLAPPQCVDVPAVSDSIAGVEATMVLQAIPQKKPGRTTLRPRQHHRICNLTRKRNHQKHVSQSSGSCDVLSASQRSVICFVSRVHIFRAPSGRPTHVIQHRYSSLST